MTSNRSDKFEQLAAEAVLCYVIPIRVRRVRVGRSAYRFLGQGGISCSMIPQVTQAFGIDLRGWRPHHYGRTLRDSTLFTPHRCTTPLHRFTRPTDCRCRTPPPDQQIYGLHACTLDFQDSCYTFFLLLFFQRDLVFC